MNWDDLRLFLAVARSGSISGGAKVLELQHSTVSRRMRKLEEELGVRLFEKKPTGFELTTAGENLLDSVTRMESEVLSVEGSLLDKDKELTGPLRVTAINNMATSVLMPIFCDFSRRYPKVSLHIMVSNTDASLVQREADLAIRLTDKPMDTLIGKRMVTVASAIYGSREYVKAVKTKGEQPQWLGVDCCAFHRTWTKQECGGHQPQQFVVDDTLLTQAALREGMGVSVLPCFMGDQDPQLMRYCDPKPEWDLGLWLLLHPDLKRTSRVLAFRDHLLESIESRRAVFEGRL